MLFGGDINTYSVARAFYERYKVKSYTFGKFATGPSYQSRIIEYTPNPKIDTDEVFYEDSEELLLQACETRPLFWWLRWQLCGIDQQA